MKRDTFSLRLDTIAYILQKEITSKSPNSLKILEILLEDVTSYKLDYILDTLHGKHDIIIPEDFIKIPLDMIPSSHVRLYFEKDSLTSMGLLVDNYVFARVVHGSKSYGEHDPYDGRLFVNLFYHNAELKMVEHGHTLNTADVIKIKQSDIPFFNGYKEELPIKPQDDSDDLPF